MRQTVVPWNVWSVLHISSVVLSLISLLTWLLLLRTLHCPALPASLQPASRPARRLSPLTRHLGKSCTRIVFQNKLTHHSKLPVNVVLVIALPPYNGSTFPSATVRDQYYWDWEILDWILLTNNNQSFFCSELVYPDYLDLLFFIFIFPLQQLVLLESR